MERVTHCFTCVTNVLQSVLEKKLRKDIVWKIKIKNNNKSR